MRILALLTIALYSIAIGTNFIPQITGICVAVAILIIDDLSIYRRRISIIVVCICGITSWSVITGFRVTALLITVGTILQLIQLFTFKTEPSRVEDVPLVPAAFSIENTDETRSIPI